MTVQNKNITVKEFDEKFDSGEDVSKYLDFSKAQKVEDFEKERFKPELCDRIHHISTYHWANGL